MQGLSRSHMARAELDTELQWVTAAQVHRTEQQSSKHLLTVSDLKYHGALFKKAKQREAHLRQHSLSSPGAALPIQ